jgi:hypothetical protein
MTYILDTESVVKETKFIKCPNNLEEILKKYKHFPSGIFICPYELGFLIHILVNFRA